MPNISVNIPSAGIIKMEGKMVSVDDLEYKNAIKHISPYEHVLDSRQFDREYIDKIMMLTARMKQNNGKSPRELEGKIVAMLFYEPSTRTRFSFESAAKRLGAETISTENAKEFSSAIKGETLEDSIRITSGYVDYIVMRHPDDDSSYRAARSSEVPIINAGSGKAQHPTQALLDVYTIYENLGRLEDLNVCVVGDLLNGRTVSSLVYLLSKYKGNSFCFVSPPNLRVKPGLKEHLEQEGFSAGAGYRETDDLDEALREADVVYMTRIQKERMSPEEYEGSKGRFIINTANIQQMKEDSILMHPLPRVDEISQEVDSDPRAKYFEQAKNGLYVRMALLRTLNWGDWKK
jgi:aspartate carbamoyltransferase catalytic subunit